MKHKTLEGARCINATDPDLKFAKKIVLYWSEESISTQYLWE